MNTIQSANFWKFVVIRAWDVRDDYDNDDDNDDENVVREAK